MHPPYIASVRPMYSVPNWSRWIGIFMFVALSHYVEHLAQLGQIYLLHWPKPQALGLLGLAWPALVQSEWLHFGYAVVMLAMLIPLRRAFHRESRIWWLAAIYVQTWHVVEHVALVTQAWTGVDWFGSPVPCSFLQEVCVLLGQPSLRPEIHFTYTTIVLALTVLALKARSRKRPVRVVNERRLPVDGSVFHA